MVNRRARIISGIFLATALMIFSGFAFFYSSTTVSAESEKKEIVVGTHLPLSGMMTPNGREMKWAYETSVADINSNGGVYILEYDKKLPVRLEIMDDGSNPSGVVRAVEDLINKKKVDFILGGYTAVYGVIPGCIVAERDQVYYHATLGFIPPWLAHRFRWSTLFFFDTAQSVAMPFEIWKSMPESERPRRPALFIEDTYDSTNFREIFHERSEEYGFPFALDLSLPAGGKDFSKQILQAKDKNVDAIIFFTSISDSVNFVKQLKASGLKLRYLQGWKGAWSNEFRKQLGNLADGILSDGHWWENYPYPGAKKLGERFYREFGYHSVTVGTYYALTQILWQAIEKAGTLNPILVRSAVLHNNFNTVMGTINYDLQGVARYPSLTFQWINGKQELIYPFELATRKIKIPDLSMSPSR